MIVNSICGFLREIELFSKNNLGKILLVFSFIFAISATYILNVVPHCCEDIQYLSNIPFEHRIKLFFWDRTINEGRYVFGFLTAILTGYIETHLLALISIFVTVATSMFIASLWNSGKKWILISILLSLNPFLLMLYPWPISFGIFNIAHFILTLCFYAYYKNNRMIILMPIAVAISLGIYQPSLSFFLELVLLHFLISSFREKTINFKKYVKFYLLLLGAIIVGYILYIFLVKVLLFMAGSGESIRRSELWHHRKINNFFDFLAYTFEGFQYFIFNGISSGIDPAQSVLVRNLSWRQPIINAYQVSLIIINLALLLASIARRCKLHIILSIAALPISIIITILPLIVSGSGFISDSIRL